MGLTIADDIQAQLRTILGRPNSDIPLHRPLFAGHEKAFVLDCISSTYVSSVGKYVERFESELASYVGVKRAVAVVNGTAALQVALQIAGVAANDEVIMPSFSFVATANAATYLGAYPHFVDVGETNLTLDVVALNDWLNDVAVRRKTGVVNKLTGRKLSAIVPMHTFGHPCDIDALLDVSERFNIPLVEDAAESLGSFYGKAHTGSRGLCAAISFNGNKIITTGGGGAILTNSDHLADLAKHLTTTAKQSHPWNYIHDQVGYNYRMPNINAALGCAQLEGLNDAILSKRRLAGLYRTTFETSPIVRFLDEPSGCTSNFWLQTLILNKEVSEHRDDILTITNSNGIMTRPAWEPLHNLEFYRSCPRAPMTVTNDMARRVINVPSSAGLV